MSEMIESFPVHPWPDPWGNLLIGEPLYHAGPLGRGECPVRFYWLLVVGCGEDWGRVG